jgi:superfamily II RNA helicase
MDPRALSGLAARRTYPLNSSFAPTYNMAVNMVATVGQIRAHELLLSSFAQFQADAALERRLRNVNGGRRRDREDAKSQGQDSRKVARAQRRTNSIAERFDRVCGVLEALGYLEGDPLQVTDSGRILTRIYSELDLVTVEAIKAGVFDGLSPAALAAVISTLVFESRKEKTAHRMPDRTSEVAGSKLRDIWREVNRLERDFRLPGADAPDIGFAEAIYDWVNGAELFDVLAYNEISAGDFVRWARQVVDQAGQIAGAVQTGPLHASSRKVIELIRRGVVDVAAD